MWKTLRIGALDINGNSHDAMMMMMHHVGVSVNVTWVTSQGPCDERVHQFEMFAILQYVVELVIKPRIFSPVARQPALTWQAVCTEIVVRRLECYHSSMKRIRSPRGLIYKESLSFSYVCDKFLITFS